MNELQLWSKKESLVALKKIYGGGLTQDEWLTFVGIGKATGLNPFKRELWAVKYGTKPAQIFIGRDGYRISAKRDETYLSHIVDSVYSEDEFSTYTEENIVVVDHKVKAFSRGELLGAYCVIKTTQGEFYNLVSVKEYKKNYESGTWKDMPETMIKKVAEAQALRMAFPDTLGGTYSEVEHHLVADEVEKTYIKVEEKKKEKGKVEVEIVDSIPPLEF